MAPPTEEQIHQYLSFDRIIDRSASIQDLAKDITTADGIAALKEVACLIEAFVEDGRHGVSARDIIESRLTPASQVYDLKLISCGAIATLAVAMLRCRGFAAALIHGTYYGNPHAWLGVWQRDCWFTIDPSLPQDVGRPDLADHYVLTVCATWSDIYDDLRAIDAQYNG